MRREVSLKQTIINFLSLRQSPLKELERSGDACFVIFVKSTRFLY